MDILPFQLAGRPFDCRRCVRIESSRIYLPYRSPIMIARYTGGASILDNFDASVGVGTVTYDVSQTPDFIYTAASFDIPQHRFQGG
jgi:hypothetical protein